MNWRDVCLRDARDAIRYEIAGTERLATTLDQGIKDIDKEKCQSIQIADIYASHEALRRHRIHWLILGSTKHSMPRAMGRSADIRRTRGNGSKPMSSV